MSDMTRWEESMKEEFIDRFNAIFPQEQLKEQYYERVKEGVETEIKKIAIPSNRKATFEQVWIFCFKKAFYPETFGALYQQAIDEAISTFEFMELSLDEALEILDDMQFGGELSSVGNTIRLYINEIPDILTQLLIETYEEMLNYDDGIYRMLIAIVNDEES